MTIYNVKISIVDLVSADDEAEAIVKLERLLRANGFDTYEGESTAFVSEDQDANLDGVVT